MPVRLLAEIATDAKPGEAGRWRINGGNEMVVTIKGVNNGKPMRAVLDLASVKLPTGRLIALADHQEERPIGFWDGFAADPTGLYAMPHLAKAEGEVEAAVLADAVRLAALVRNGVPVQASVGVEPGSTGTWEHVQPGLAVTLNGRTYSGDGELPLYVLRGAELFETSIVTFGADDDTGRLAAKLPTPKDHPMPKAIEVLAKLLARHDPKHHAMIAKCAAEDKTEQEADDAVKAADSADKDAQIAKLTGNISALKCAIEQQGYMVADDYSVSPAEKRQEQASEKHGAASAARGAKRGVTFSATERQGEERQGEGEEPKSLWDATRMIAKAEGIKPDFKARAMAARKYPNLVPNARTGVVG